MHTIMRARYKMNETEFTDTVIQLAKLFGWRVVHFRPARTERGWRTAVQGDPGFPDLVLAREGEVIIAELKSESGRLRTGQPEWGSALGRCYRLWRPSDLEHIKQELARKGSQ